MDSPIDVTRSQPSPPHPNDGELSLRQEQNKTLFGFVIFLLSESIVFLSFFAT